jgi:hypothetical protein
MTFTGSATHFDTRSKHSPIFLTIGVEQLLYWDMHAQIIGETMSD